MGRKNLLKFFLLFIAAGCFHSAKAQTYCPSNIDFELGNASNWKCFTATNMGSSGITTPSQTSALLNRHVITSGTNTDYYGGFPIVDPVGGTYSLRLGNDNINAQVDQVRYTFTVPSSINNYSLIYRYAVVLENPTHNASEQPYFRVQVYDSATGSTINCASFTYVSNSSLPGFSASTRLGNHAGGSMVYYKPWATASLNLSGQGGKTLVVEFTTADCALGAHMGYGYVDMSCGLFAISSTTCNPTTPLSAPPGFQTYTWYNANYSTVVGTGQSITVTTPSTATQYHVVLTPYTGYGCQDTLHTQITGSTLAVNAGPDTMLCNNSSITLNAGATGSATPFTYSWAPATGLSCTTCASPVASPAVTTNYVVTVTDTVGCVRRDTVKVVAAPNPGVTATANNCVGGSIGTATVSVVMGTPPYTYSWNTSPARTTSTITGLTSGTYVVTVTDSKGCTGIDSAAVLNPTPIVPSISKTVDPCNTGNNATSITVSAAGGFPGYTYALDNGSYGSSGTFSSLSSGTYTIHIKDSVGCIKDTVITVTNTSPLTISAVTVPPACNGGANGSITIVASGGKPPYQYAFGSGAYGSQSTFTGLAAGNYAVHIKDSNNCDRHINTLALTQPSAITVTASKTDLLCNGDASGTITISASGGTPGYTYAVNGGAPAAGNAFTGIAAGTHTVVVTDSFGCTKNASVTLTQPAALNLSAVSVNPACNAGTNGAITISGSGGTAPYQYAIGNGAFAAAGTFSGLAAGTYTVRVKDANNCTKDSTIILAQPSAVSASVGITGVSCNGGNNGTATITGSGGTAPYTYARNAGTYSANNSFTGLAAGTHILHVKDANGCIKDTTIAITAPAKLDLSYTTVAPLCYGDTNGSVSLNASGGTGPYSYALGSNAFSAATTYSNLSAGTYVLHIRDANNCTKDSTITLSQPGQLQLSLNVSNIFCNGGATGAITINATGGTTAYTYAINSGTFGSSNVFGSLNAGTHSVHLKDANGCAKDTNITISQSASLQLGLAIARPLCNGAANGSVNVTAAGGTAPYQYAMNSGAFGTASGFGNLSAGTYVIHVKDVNNCAKDSTITITEPAAVMVTATSTNVSCNGGNNGSITVTATGGTAPYLYARNSGVYGSSDILSGLSAGTHVIHVKDANGCTKDTTITITEPARLNLSYTSVAPLCNGDANGSISLTASGGAPPYSYAIGAGVFSPATVFNNLSAGTYILHIKDANNCTKDSTITLSQPALLNMALSISHVLCNGGGTGAVTANGTGGTTAYTYAINGGGFGNSNVFSSLNAGTHTVHLKDTNGCTKDTTIIITQSSSLGLTYTVTQPLCHGAANGAVSLTAAGGSAPYQYAIGAGSFGSSATFTGLAAGTYVLHVKDANNCAKDSTITISQPAQLSFSVTTSNVVCNGGNSGAVTINATGGTPAYTYAIGAGAFGSGNVLTGLAAGTYTVHLKDANGCTKDSNVIITEPAPLMVSHTATQPLCNGGATGSITLAASGATAPYQYALGSGNFGASPGFTGLSAGTYSIHVKDANGCTKDTSVTLSEPALLGLSLTVTNVLCGNAVSSATVAGIGGTAPYQYAIDAGAFGSSANFAGLSSGSHTVHVKDANGCTKDSTFTVFVASQPGFTLSVAPLLCHGDSTSVTVAANGGTAPYTYAANSGSFSSNNVLSALSAGTHVIHLKDANGCTKDSTIAIAQPAKLALGFTHSAPLCSGSQNASVTISGTGGIAPYTYAVNSGGYTAAASFAGLGAGTDTLHIKDANGCTEDSIISINEPASLSFSIAVTNVLCNGDASGSIAVTAAGGTAPYQYAANSGAFGNLNVLNGLSAGTHIIHLKDANGCTKDTTLTITEPTPLSLAYSATQPLCNGAANGVITMSGSGGTSPYQYALSQGAYGSASVFNGVPAATYVLHLKDAAGCVKDSTIVISEPAPLILVPAVSNVLCFGANTGSASITASGGISPYTYSIGAGSFGSSSAFSNLAAGTYILHLKDAGGCTKDSTVVISQPQPLVPGYTAVQPLCNGAANGSVTITASGGTAPYLYSMNSSGFAANGAYTNLLAGPYTIHVQDANGCVEDSNIILGQPAVLTAAITKTDISCYGMTNGTATVNASGGTAPYTYSWTGTTQTTATVNALAIGSYTATVTDAKGCITVATISITQPAALSATAAATAPLCANTATGSANVSVSGGKPPYAYSWTASASLTTASVTGLSSGAYLVTVTDDNGCTASDSVVVPHTAPIVVNVTSGNVSCSGGRDGMASVTVSNGNGPYSYAWNTTPVQTTSNANKLPAGNYTVTVTSADGCIGTGAVAVMEPAELIASASAQSTCPGTSGGSLSAAATGGTSPYSYVWQSVNAAYYAASVSSLAPGTYVLKVTDSKGCNDTLIASIRALPAPNVDAGAGLELCEGSAGQLHATGAQTYAWTPSHGLSCTNCPSPVASPSAAATYFVTGTDANGCMATDTVHIDVIRREAISAAQKHTICAGDSIQLGVSGGVAVQWLQPIAEGSGSNPWVRPASTTRYQVVITQNDCFTDTLSQEVEVLPLPTVELGPDMEVVTGSTIQLNAAVTNATSIAWTPAEGLSCTDCYNPQFVVYGKSTFVARVSNALGCAATDTISIRDICDASSFFFPNVFTPNGDGSNDRFYPQSSGSYVVDHFMIYNRWGEIVFSASNITANDASAGWDGSYKGDQVKPDVYVYVMDARCANGQKVVIRGDVTLIR